MKKEQITYLLDAYTWGRATEEETNELMNWVLKAENDEDLKGYVLDIWEQQHSGEIYAPVDWEELYSQIISASDIEKPKVSGKVRVLRWVAAASLLLTASAIYFYFNWDKQENTLAYQQIKKDVAPPSGDKAVLILADGSKIVMDSTSHGIIARQGNVEIVKNEDGAVSYMGRGSNAFSYNTFDVPKGSKPLSLMLADGSRVWLNVGSSLTFPTVFTGKERVVTMEGEAYFEVAHNDVMPFKVKHGDVTINVRGTHFNVNGYTEEEMDKITLLEGSVVVNKGGLTKTLLPGQQAMIQKSEADIRIQKDVDLNQVMAWRHGKFIFNQAMDIQDIMRQLGRWYNVDVIFKGVVTQRFWGAISRDVNLSQVLKILEAAGGVKFDIEGDKITVLPSSP